MILKGDCIEVMDELEDDSIDALVTDPPAGIAFMNKAWDSDKGGRDEWIHWMTGVMLMAHQKLKPGAHGFVWALPRTSHWTATACEDAGFEVRDVVMHVFGSGFPKSHNVSKALDKLAGAEREVVIINKKDVRTNAIKNNTNDTHNAGFKPDGSGVITAPATTEAKQWDGYGTALKPAAEHWVLIRKPLSEKTVAKNVLKHGTGGINVDASRVEVDKTKETDNRLITGDNNKSSHGGSFLMGGCQSMEQLSGLAKSNGKTPNGENATAVMRRVSTGAEHKMYGDKGRFPANFICSGDARDLLDEQTKNQRASKPSKTGTSFKATGAFPIKSDPIKHDDSGGASRFFYCAKASKSERNAGLTGKAKAVHRFGAGIGEGKTPDAPAFDKNHHPTVKAQKLMRYLIKMITPPNGTVLDPFAGSGSTGVAAKSLGYKFIGIEAEEEYVKIANARIDNTVENKADA